MMNEKIYNKLLAIPITISFSIIALFCFFCIGLSRVDAATWVEFRSEGDNYLCGTNQDSLSCTYSTNVIGYNVIIEEIELKANKTYELEIYWNLQTAITPGNQSGYINDNNWQDFTATIDGKLWGVNGPSLPTQNRTWQKLSQERIFGIGDVPDYASYYYKYSNVFELASDQNYERLYFEVRKRQQWTSIGMPTWYTQVYTPLVVFTEFTYTLSEIGDNGISNIIASGNKNTEDIINNQNQNTDKVVDAIEKSEETNKGILEVITDFFGNFFSNLIGIFIPDNFDFLNGFLDTLENKLGFIASVPIQFLEFLADLVTIDFDTVSSVSLPHFEILGYTFIEEQEIDLSDIMAVFQPYRIYTNIACVCFCIRYLMKLYENFANKE